MVNKRGKWKKSYIIYAALTALVILLNIIAWNSTAFCDAYIKYIFPIWVNTYGRFMNIFSFSVGEIMLFLGVGLAVLFVLVVIAAVCLKVTEVIAAARLKVAGVVAAACRKAAGAQEGADRMMVGLEAVETRNESDEEATERILDRTAGTEQIGIVQKGRASMFARFCKGYMTFFVWLVLIVCVIMTLNCTILYHASTFSEKYFGTSQTEYTLDDLIQVRNMVVEKCNELSAQMERDENGRIIYEGDIRRDAVAAMQKLGEIYDQLDGYYPYPKPLATSDFFSQQHMCGYYFPFSLEANYNDVMYIMNKHSTMCHELAHLRGYIFEDEANFISYLACIQSEDPVMQYSGFLSVLYYLDNDYYAAVGSDWNTYITQPRILQQVHDDNVFVTQEEWDRIEDKAVLDTETVDEVSDTFTDTTLKVNGVSDGMISYSRVVKLLLQYYEVQGLICGE